MWLYLHLETVHGVGDLNAAAPAQRLGLRVPRLADQGGLPAPRSHLAWVLSSALVENICCQPLFAVHLNVLCEQSLLHIKYQGKMTKYCAFDLLTYLMRIL